MSKESVKEYPLTVVGTVRDGKVRYYIANLATGQRDIMMYDSCSIAHIVLALMHTGEADFCPLSKYGFEQESSSNRMMEGEGK